VGGHLRLVAAAEEEEEEVVVEEAEESTGSGLTLRRMLMSAVGGELPGGLLVEGYSWRSCWSTNLSSLGLLATTWGRKEILSLV